MQTVFQTSESPQLLVLRLVLAAVVFPHGAQKALGWFGGLGFRGTVEYLSGLGLPSAVGIAIILAEFLGPIALAAGFMSRVAALSIVAIMLGAILLVHWSNGFFMNWFGTQAGEGFEYHLLAIGVALVIVIGGSGLLSIDGLVARR